MFDRNVHCLLGLPFDVISTAGAIDRIRNAASQSEPCFISTANLNFLIGCRTDQKFRDSVVNSDLSLADGMPLVWIARFLGIPIQERVAGSTVFEKLKERSPSPITVFFFGGKEGVAEAACHKINQAAAGLRCVGFESPTFGSIDEMSGDETIDRINSSGAKFVVVALGAKKGQAWIVRNRPRLLAPIISHLGAVINFTAGTVARAPVWVQQLGLEWLWRIKEEPSLWRRYLIDGIGFFKLLVTRVLPYAWYAFRYKTNGKGEMTTTVGDDAISIRLSGPWTRDNLAALRESFSAAMLVTKDLTLELDNVTYVDSAFIGLLILAQGRQFNRGKRLFIASASRRVTRLIRYSCAEYLLD